MKIKNICAIIYFTHDEIEPFGALFHLLTCPYQKHKGYNQKINPKVQEGLIYERSF